jgi:hypothetical protein
LPDWYLINRQPRPAWQRTQWPYALRPGRSLGPSSCQNPPSHVTQHNRSTRGRVIPRRIFARTPCAMRHVESSLRRASPGKQNDATKAQRAQSLRPCALENSSRLSQRSRRDRGRGVLYNIRVRGVAGRWRLRTRCGSSQARRRPRGRTTGTGTTRRRPGSRL